MSSTNKNQTGPDQTGPDLRYEDARDELVEVVKRLEGGGLTLEESLALWERGEQLAAICQGWLDQARTRLDAATGRSESGEAPESPPSVR